ncbi:hypothetical protein [Streptomyces pyxinae]|uniref:hypothetical protein n=1 Tax=Streptomyces pyxinae TaxID=2970734 RepID=UPI002867D11E|nr:hypothetical protein [Streptomyces sp. LP05-1]
MDEQMAALAATAANAVVGSLATETWERARVLVGGLWRRPGQAAEARAQVAESRELLLSGVHEADEQDLTALWRVRFRQLLASDSDAARALAELVAELGADAREKPGRSGTRHTELRAEASNGGRVYQAGRDMTNITHR